MKIWDIHCHLPSGRVKGDTLKAQMGNLLETADRMGIDKIGAFLRVDNDDRSNEAIREAVEHHHPRVLGFVYVNLPDTKRAVDKINRFIADGPFVGVKLGGRSGICSKPEYDPLFKRAVELGAIIYQHTWLKLGGEPPTVGAGNLERESTPQDVINVAKRYPEHSIICGHNGGDWELGTRAVRSQPNVPVEVSGGYPARGQVELAVRELGADRVVYGSDVTGRSFGSQIGKVWDAHVPQAHREKIFSGNIARLHQNILKQKGYL